jgi:MFS family permease
MVGVVCVLAWGLLRNTPADMGLSMIGRMPGQEPSPPVDPGGARPFLVHLGCVYFLFGLTYIVYGTFIVTTMIDEYGFGQGLAGTFWSWVGFFSLFSGPVLGRVSDRFGRKAGLVSAYAIQTAAYLLAGLGAPLAGTAALYGSVVLYGLAAWSIPTIMTATIADRLGPAGTAKGFAFITFFVAIGQVAAPTLAGWLAEATGGFSLAYTLSGVLTLAAIGLTLRLRVEPRA